MKYLVFASLFTLGVFSSECHPKYECCKKCQTVYTDDEGQWGVENKNWCFIEPSHCSSSENTVNTNTYPTCNHCNIHTTDETGNWGIENNNWCIIQDSQCITSVNNNNNDNDTENSNNATTDGHKNVVPIISIVSKSGNNKFVTEPITKHVTEMSFWLPKDAPVPYYEDCTVTIEDENGKKVLEGATGKAKVRGNFTSSYVKKSLRLKFDEKHNLLGLNHGKEFNNWLLLAQYKDTSLLRDKTAFALSRELLGEDGLYASDAKFVELNINGEYWGVYLLAEVQQIGDGRISITEASKNYTGTDIGYFLEHDIMYAKYEDPRQSIRITFDDNAALTPYDGEGGNGVTINAINDNDDDYFNTDTNQTQTEIDEQPTTTDNEDEDEDEEESEKSEESDDEQNEDDQAYDSVPADLLNMTIKNDIYSQEQHDFIEKYMNNVYKIMYEAAYNKKSLKFNSDYTGVVDAPELTSKEAIERVVDVNSLADMYIISELSCDADLFFSSFYMDVDFGKNGSKKLRFEAPWDFDSGFGNKDVCMNGEGFFASNLIPDTTASGYQINPWLAVIMYEDWYQEIIRNQWTKAYDNGVFSRAIEMIQSDAQTYEEAFARNSERWDDEVRRVAIGYEVVDREMQCITEADSAAYVSEWIEARVDFINKHWHK